MKNKILVMIIVGVLLLSSCAKVNDDAYGDKKTTKENVKESKKESKEETTTTGQEQTTEKTQQTTTTTEKENSAKVDDFLTEIEYSNLIDEATRNEVKVALLDAGLPKEDVENFIATVVDYNETVGEFGGVKEGFVVSKELQPIYDVNTIDELWLAKKDEFVGNNCRMTALQLVDSLVNVDGEIVKENKVLFMDEDAIMSSGNKKFTEDFIGKFRTFFGDISTPLEKDMNIHLKNVKNYWKDKKVFFKDSKAKIITVWFHNDLDNNLFVGHTGVLVPAKDGGLYFIEKISFQEPYQVLKFKDRQGVSDYLMAKYDVSFGQPTAKPFILENDELIEGYRPNPKNVQQ